MRQDFTAWVLYSQISIVERLLGHRDGRMTQRCVHLAPENLREAVQIFKDDYHKISTGPVLRLKPVTTSYRILIR